LFGHDCCCSATHADILIVDRVQVKPADTEAILDFRFWIEIQSDKRPGCRTKLYLFISACLCDQQIVENPFKEVGKLAAENF
jgi:hypothetical protein